MEANAHGRPTVSPFSPFMLNVNTDTYAPAQHVCEAYKAHISQFEGATMTGLQELLTEVQAYPLHLQHRERERKEISSWTVRGELCGCVCSHNSCCTLQMKSIMPASKGQNDISHAICTQWCNLNKARPRASAADPVFSTGGLQGQDLPSCSTIIQ